MMQGVLPDGTYDQNTKVEYCCRKDGSAERPIQLPSSAPFYLYKLGDICQEVQLLTLHQKYVEIQILCQLVSKSVYI